MEFDPADSLTGFQEHQSDDVSDLFNSEADHMPSRNFVIHSKNRDFFASFRAQAISLVLQVKAFLYSFLIIGIYFFWDAWILLIKLF